MRGRLRGFTLVELVVVITILGILAAIALPRFTDLATGARTSKVRALSGSLETAAGLAKATALANGVSCATATGTTATMEGAAIALNYCYPQALGVVTDGIVQAANLDTTKDGIALSGGAATAGSTVTLTVNGALTPANCSVAYTSPSAANNAPAIVITTSGC